MMGTLTIKAFTSKEGAQAHFSNLIQEDTGIDGVFIKSALSTEVFANGADPIFLSDGEPLYLVLGFPEGTGLQIDTNVTEAAEEPE